MNQAKYIGMDVHQATISVAVMDSAGKLDLGVHPRNESDHDSAVHRWAARQLAGDFRRRNFRGLVV